MIIRSEAMARRKRRSGHPLPEHEKWRIYCRYPESMIPGNRVKLLVNGESAYESMICAIGEAEESILMDSYIFNDDIAGQIFADALATSAIRGIVVHLIVDGVGTFHVPAPFFEKLRRAGVKVLIYRPLAPWRRNFGLLKRNHRKLLVVDGRIGFIGGMNIGMEWLSTHHGGKGWHDIHVRVEGPVVRELSRLSISTWHTHEGVVLDPALFLPKLSPLGGTYATIVGSRESKKRKAIRQSYLKAIRQAKTYIYIANAYFLPDLGFRRALKNACKRGVDVRVMVPKKGDIYLVQLASQALYRRLLRMGVRIFLWKDAVLHAKTAVIDDQWATIGSFNLDHRSWRMNLEVNINTVGVEFSGHLKQVFFKDQENCEKLTLVSWQKRPFWLKLLERFVALFRKWM